MTKIISAMAGAGKSTLIKNNPHLKMHDSDSQQFSFKTDGQGNYLTHDGDIATTKEQRVANPNFESDYLADIEKRCLENDVVFVSAHKVVRDLLNAGEKDWVYVAYEPEIKAEVVNRIRNRDTKQPNDIIANIVDENWINWMLDAKSYPAPKTLFLKSGQYLSDVINL